MQPPQLQPQHQPQSQSPPPLLRQMQTQQAAQMHSQAVAGRPTLYPLLPHAHGSSSSSSSSTSSTPSPASFPVLSPLASPPIMAITPSGATTSSVGSGGSNHSHRLPPQPLPIGVLQQDIGITLQTYRFPDPATTSRLDLDSSDEDNDADDDDEDGEEGDQDGGSESGRADDNDDDEDDDPFRPKKAFTGFAAPPSIPSSENIFAMGGDAVLLPTGQRPDSYHPSLSPSPPPLLAPIDPSQLPLQSPTPALASGQAVTPMSEEWRPSPQPPRPPSIALSILELERYLHGWHATHSRLSVVEPMSDGASSEAMSGTPTSVEHAAHATLPSTSAPDSDAKSASSFSDQGSVDDLAMSNGPKPTRSILKKVSVLSKSSSTSGGGTSSYRTSLRRIDIPIAPGFDLSEDEQTPSAAAPHTGLPTPPSVLGEAITSPVSATSSQIKSPPLTPLASKASFTSAHVPKPEIVQIVPVVHQFSSEQQRTTTFPPPPTHLPLAITTAPDSVIAALFSLPQTHLDVSTPQLQALGPSGVPVSLLPPPPYPFIPPSSSPLEILAIGHGFWKNGDRTSAFRACHYAIIASIVQVLSPQQLANKGRPRTASSSVQIMAPPPIPLTPTSARRPPVLNFSTASLRSLSNSRSAETSAVALYILAASVFEGVGCAPDADLGLALLEAAAFVGTEGVGSDVFAGLVVRRTAKEAIRASVRQTERHRSFSGTSTTSMVLPMPLPMPPPPPSSTVSSASSGSSRASMGSGGLARRKSETRTRAGAVRSAEQGEAEYAEPEGKERSRRRSAWMTKLQSNLGGFKGDAAAGAPSNSSPLSPAAEEAENVAVKRRPSLKFLMRRKSGAPAPESGSGNGAKSEAPPIPPLTSSATQSPAAPRSSVLTTSAWQLLSESSTGALTNVVQPPSPAPTLALPGARDFVRLATLRLADAFASGRPGIPPQRDAAEYYLAVAKSLANVQAKQQQQQQQQQQQPKRKEKQSSLLSGRKHRSQQLPHEQQQQQQQIVNLHLPLPPPPLQPSDPSMQQPQRRRSLRARASLDEKGAALRGTRKSLDEQGRPEQQRGVGGGLFRQRSLSKGTAEKRTAAAGFAVNNAVEPVAGAGQPAVPVLRTVNGAMSAEGAAVGGGQAGGAGQKTPATWASH